MDGMNDLGRVCVIATTNRPAALDPALRRPGRFDHEIEIGLPDAEARLHILNIHTRDMPTDPDLDLEHIAQHTGNYSGADLEALCREAALACMRRTINLSDFERRIAPHQLSALSVTTYDFRTAMKRVGPIRRWRLRAFQLFAFGARHLQNSLQGSITSSRGRPPEATVPASRSRR